jgi:histidinol-phosphate aminotransferase
MPLVPPYIEALRPYEAGRSIEEVQRTYSLSYISKLASNENPLGPSPLALDAMSRCMSGLNYYPNSGLDLRRVLAEKYETKVENVIAGSGSESIISNIIRTFLGDEDEVLTTEAAFAGFQVLAKSRGVAYRTVPYRDWHYDLTALAAAINDRTKIIYLANPNNPTGTIFSKHEFDAFYSHVPERVLIILDEAYFEYAKDTPRYPDSMHYRYDNVITLRTFSKVYGLAGVRIGYGFAHERLIGNLLKVKLPFEPSTLAQAAGIGALADREFLHKSLELNARGLRYLTTSLREIGLTVVPSEANFLMIVLPSPEHAARLTNDLLQQGIIIRPLAGFGLPNCVRISTGTAEDNQRCVQAIQKLEVPLSCNS